MPSASVRPQVADVAVKASCRALPSALQTHHVWRGG
nr:MAG TPA: hypothetical protein [Caudoviricetes sp.]